MFVKKRVIGHISAYSDLFVEYLLHRYSKMND